MSTSALQRITFSPAAKLLRWLPTVLWLCVLAWFSTDLFSAHNTGSILWKVAHALFSGITRRQFEILHFFVRKAAHFGSYGFLGVLAFYAWRATFPGPQRWTFRWSGLALALTLAAASLDEFHQTFVSSRTGNPRDVALDMVGALFFQILIATFVSGRRKRRAGLA